MRKLLLHNLKNIHKHSEVMDFLQSKIVHSSCFRNGQLLENGVFVGNTVFCVFWKMQNFEPCDPLALFPTKYIDVNLVISEQS